MGASRRKVPRYALAALFTLVIMWFLMAYPPPGYYRHIDMTLEGPFAHSQGFEYQTKIPLIWQSGENVVGDLSLILMEDGKALPHPCSFRAAIQKQGKGAYTNRDKHLYFATSDNSNPNSNGRSYSARYNVRFHVVLYLILLFFGYVAALIFLYGSGKAWLSGAQGWQIAYYILGNLILGATIIQAIFWVLTENRVENHGALVRSYYNYAFNGIDDQIKTIGSPGLAINYMPHHYLNYALNPDVPYCGVKQFNRLYKIRRTEDIKSRDKVKWRAVVIGGSTTFGEGLSREENTWPYLLEASIRQRYGIDCDVINGGVGGYTLLENFIHYITILRHLKPNIVILFVGINDVSPRLFSQLKVDYSNYRKPWSSGQPVFRLPRDSLRWVYPYRYYFLNKVIIETFDTGIAAVVSKKGPSFKVWEAALKRNDSSLYQATLDGFVRFVKSEGAKLIVVPQLFRVVRGHDNIFMKGVVEHNDVNRKVAQKNNVLYLDGVLNPDLFVSSDFLDNCHFSKAGSRKMAKRIFDFLGEHNLLPSTQNLGLSKRSTF